MGQKRRKDDSPNHHNIRDVQGKESLYSMWDLLETVFLNRLEDQSVHLKF